MYRKVLFFSQFFIFFTNLICKESLYYCNSCMLEQMSYLRKFWFLRYGPKCSWAVTLHDFSINHRTLKFALFHKEINEINWFLVCLSNSFHRNRSLGFSDFGTMVGNSNIEKLTEASVPGKFILGPNLDKRAQNGPKIRFLGFLWKILWCYFFLEIIDNEN